LFTYKYNIEDNIITLTSDETRISQDRNPQTQQKFQSEQDALEWAKDYVSNFEDTLNMTSELDLLKQDKIKEMNIACEKAICTGFYSSALGEKHFYAFDKEEAQINFTQQSSLINLAPDRYTIIYWKTEDAGVLAHAKEQFINVLFDADTHKTSNISMYWSLKDKINNCTCEDEVNAISWE
jgi:hypothetical protein